MVFLSLKTFDTAAKVGTQFPIDAVHDIVNSTIETDERLRERLRTAIDHMQPHIVRLILMPPPAPPINTRDELQKALMGLWLADGPVAREHARTALAAGRES